MMRKPKKQPIFIEDYAKEHGYLLPMDAQKVVREYIFEALRSVVKFCPILEAQQEAHATLMADGNTPGGLTQRDLIIRALRVVHLISLWDSKDEFARQVRANLYHIIQIQNHPGCSQDCSSCTTPIC